MWVHPIDRVLARMAAVGARGRDALPRSLVVAAQHRQRYERARHDSVLALIVNVSAAILRVSIALGVCAALINLLVWRQPIMEMANGHTWAFRVLYAMWFVLGWGVATGALTGLAVSSMRRRSPGRLSAAVAFVVGLFLTSTVCLVLYRGFTDAKFMHDAMSGLHPNEVNSYIPGTDMDMDPAHTRPTQL